MKIYLASKSPRRKELLKQMSIDFKVLDIDIPEVVQDNEDPYIYSARITVEKLNAAWQKVLQDNLVIYPLLCADTEVIVDNKILGKPLDYQDAFAMLKKYSGKTHVVITSVGVKYYTFEKIVTHTTKVTFASLTDEDIKEYLSHNTYLDKAGGYGIQSWIGQFIERIEGCFNSVMGLPLNVVREILTELKDKVIDKQII